jgi:hypothetical protein
MRDLKIRLAYAVSASLALPANADQPPIPIREVWPMSIYTIGGDDPLLDDRRKLRYFILFMISGRISKAVLPVLPSGWTHCQKAEE